VPESKRFSLPRLILCEGPEDKAFLHAFIAYHDLPKCHIRHTGGRDPNKAGNTRFGTALRGFRTDSSFSCIKKILLVSDNDANQSDQFTFVSKQVNDAKFIAPAEMLKASKNSPPITIMMIPVENIPGNLEHICIEAARNCDKLLADRVDKFLEEIRADRWEPQKRSKLWLRVMLSAAHKPDPFIFLGSVFRNDELRHLIPFDEAFFREVKSALETFLA
jgi:hypothetical protein